MKALLIGIVVALALLGPVPARAADVVSFDAMLILANNDGAPLDRRLDQFGNQLRRIFKFEYFKHLGEGRTQVSLPSEFEVDLGSGQVLKVKASGSGDRVRAEVEWVGDGKSKLKTTVNMKKGAHAILGGVPDKDKKGTLIVALMVR